MVVGCRGEFADEGPQHRAWGYEKTQYLLKTYDVEAVDLRDYSPESIPGLLNTYMTGFNTPIALLIRRGVIDEN